MSAIHPRITQSAAVCTCFMHLFVNICTFEHLSALRQSQYRVLNHRQTVENGVLSAEHAETASYRPFRDALFLPVTRFEKRKRRTFPPGARDRRWWAVRVSPHSHSLVLSSLALRARAAAVRRTPAPLRVRDPGTENENAGRFRPARAIEDGGPSGSRTLDLGIKSPLLCQLS